MKFFHKNRFINFVCFFILFALFSPIILSSAIPPNATVTKSEASNMWIPEGMRWVVRTRESPAEFVLENTAQKLDKNTKSYNTTVYFCGVLPIKKVNISVTEDKTVILGGEAVGINLRTDGVLVAELDSIKTVSGKSVSPARDAGIKSGDIIESINGIKVYKKEEISEIVESGDNPLKICGNRNGKNFECEIESVKDETGKNAIGIWIRDTVAGIGTVTFYSDNSFAALGHPICDIDTGKYVSASGGAIYSAAIVGVDKGEKGSPGSLKGIFTTNKTGEITANSQYGVFGTSVSSKPERIPVGKKNEIRCKEAQIVCDIGKGPEKFDIEIQRIMPESDTSKSMVIHITDKTLLEKTGGIVQGMSGSPILQNGKIVGAVTHVFVNDPTRGYGIFIENMLAEAEKIK
ncbi:MAG: SpoIVB peptidase [Clostridia bacterium]|nr:SpoIVB peptidase [Clostridia bacterium]